MDEYILVKPTLYDEKSFKKMISEWFNFGGRINPGLLRCFDGDYKVWLKILDNWDKGIGIENEVPQTFYFLKNESGEILGAASLRQFLNETNILDGGHIAYGIAPKYRGKGLGNRILQLSLQKLLEMGVKKALVTCDSDNFASQAVILYNGGVLENKTFDEDGVPINRYWIDL